jgi:hypothetical protein
VDYALRFFIGGPPSIPGAERDAMLRKARQAETGSHMSEWLSSPGLRPPD